MNICKHLAWKYPIWCPVIVRVYWEYGRLMEGAANILQNWDWSDYNKAEYIFLRFERKEGNVKFFTY